MKKFLFLVLFFITACAPKEKTIVGQTYHLVQASQPIEITLSFDKDGRFYGKAINNYFGVYEIKDNNITFNLQGQTMMVGPKFHMAFEADYFKSLRTIRTFELNDNILILNGDQKYIFEQSNPN